MVFAFGHPWGQRNVLTGGVLSAVTSLRGRQGEIPDPARRCTAGARQLRRPAAQLCRGGHRPERHDLRRRPERGHPGQRHPRVPGNRAREDAGSCCGGRALIRVAVVAPGMALRIGLREVLRGLPDVEVVAEATSPAGPARRSTCWCWPRPMSSRNWTKVRRRCCCSTQRPGRSRPSGRLSRVGRPAAARPAPEELSAAVHALAEGLWVGSPSLAQCLLRPASRPLLGRAPKR